MTTLPVDCHTVRVESDWFRCVRPDVIFVNDRRIEFDRILGAGNTPQEAIQAAVRELARSERVQSEIDRATYRIPPSNPRRGYRWINNRLTEIE